MKWLTLLFVCFSATAFAQNTQNSLMQKLKRAQELRTGEKSYVTPFIQESFGEKLEAKTHIPEVTDSVAVTTLPLDKMPCLVPDMRLHHTTPNAGNENILKHPVDPGIYAYKKRPKNNVITTK